MTTETVEPTPVATRATVRVRFAVAFVVGLVAALVIGVGALYAYDSRYAGRILPGVRVGGVDLSGMTPDEARGALEDAYGSVGRGHIVLVTPDGEERIAFRTVGRRVDVERLVEDALGIGRTGGPIERVIADARTALRGVALEPTVTFDPEAVAAQVERVGRRIDREPRDAQVGRVKGGFVLTPGSNGRRGEREPVAAALLAELGRLDAPDRVVIEYPTAPVVPDITTAEAFNARIAAERIAARLAITRGDETFHLNSSVLRTWISFVRDEHGGLEPIVDTAELPELLAKLATDIDTAPRNAGFTYKGSRITGVIPAEPGTGLDVEATAAKVEQVLAARGGGATQRTMAPVMRETEPALTTAEAEAAVPKMRRISTWTTYFAISEKNGFGANIWIPTLDLDGYVVAPGEEFDFWKAIGPVSRDRGYRDGGAIINGKTEPQGALAGGICSCSTTLFNAALRAGFEMGDRRNHYYYIDRYPLGLDATVWKSSSGAVQTMSWTNDTEHPVLIRGFRIKEGNDGYVRFDLYSVPTGRKVSFSKPLVKEIRKARETVEYTSSLKPGEKQRVEYPADGKKVWVTRIVRDRSGAVIHEDTYYSNYARIDGLTLVGKGTPPSAPTPTPTPTPTP